MRRALPNVLPWLVLVGASTAAFFVLRTREGAGEGWSWNSPAGHFWIVSAAALMCAFLAIASGIAASRAANWRVTMIALAFIAMAGIFAVHGLTTPGFIVTGPTRAPAVATVEGYDLAAYEGYGAAAPVETAAAPGEPTSRFYNVTGLSSRLAILTSVSLLAVAAMRWPASVEAWLTRRRRAVLAAGIVTVVTYATLGFLAP